MKDEDKHHSEKQDRERDGKFKGANAKANPNRRMWYDLPDDVDLVLIDVPVEEELYSGDIEHLQGWNSTLLLYIAKGRHQHVTIDLTLSTAEEIDNLAEFFDTALKYAREHAAERDERALEAHNEGTAEVLFHRLYRSVPRVVDRSREVLAHRARLQERSDEAAGGDGSDPAE